MKSAKRTLATLVKTAAALIAGFLLLETLLFVFNDAVFHSSFYIFDPDMGFRVRPYAVYGNETANEFGFNDRDYPHEPPPGTYRIEILGDSYNWMGGQKRNYTALLEETLGKEWGPGRVEVIAAGYSQTHTGEQLKLLEKYGIQYHPRLVILGFFTGNDFYDADPQRHRIVVGGATTDVFDGRDLFFTIGGTPFVLKSRLFLYLEEVWRAYRHRRILQESRGPGAPALVPAQAGFTPRNRPPARPGSDAVQPLPSSEYLQSLRLRTQFYDPRHFAEYETHVTHVFESLREMRRFLAERDCDFIVAAYPDEVQVSAPLRARFLAHFGLDASDWQWDRPQDLLDDFCRREGIDYWDLTATFRQAWKPDSPLYIPNDSHWDDAGNRLAAEFFRRQLHDRLEQALSGRAGPGPTSPRPPSSPPAPPPGIRSFTAESADR